MRQTANSFSTVFESYSTIDIKPKTYLYQPGQSITHCTQIITGCVRQFLITSSGQELTIHLHRPGAVIPLLVLLTGSDNRYFFETQTKTTINQAPKTIVLHHLRQHPQLTEKYLHNFASAVDGLVSRLEIKSQEKQSDQLLALLQYLAQKFGHSRNDRLILDLPLTHQDLANWLGIARETVTKHLSTLEKSGQVSHRHKSYILPHNPSL